MSRRRLAARVRRCGTLARVSGLALPLALAACAPRATTPTLPSLEPVARAGLPSSNPTVRVGLLVDTARLEITAPTAFDWVEPAGQRTLGSAAAGSRWVASADADGTIRVAPSGEPERGYGARGMLLAVPRHDTATISLNGSPYRGMMLLRAGKPGRLTAVNVLDMETYLLGVVPSEIGPGRNDLEASKVQAVAARTYAITYLGRRAALGFDVLPTVDDQVYGGVKAEYGPVSRAVRETAGQILTHGGQPIEAYYSSTCAGHSAAMEEVWPERTATGRPYLKAVRDVNPATGLAYDSISPRFKWTERWTAAEFNQMLARTLADSARKAGLSAVGEVRDLRILERTPSGRVAHLQIETTTGTFHVGRDRIRWILYTPKNAPLNSAKFDVEVMRAPDGRVQEVVARGGGWGHAVGMCQWGAIGRARAGQDYRAILSTYYPNTELVDLY